MIPQITRYFPPGMRFIPPAGKTSSNGYVKITMHYFEKDKVELLSEPWASYQYGQKYEGLKLFYRGKIINLTIPPTFTDQFPHTPGTAAEAFIGIHDADLHSGQFVENEKFEVWYLDVVKRKLWLIGDGRFDQVNNNTVRQWSTKDFVARYGKKLEPVIDTDGISIDLADALSRLEFLEDYSLKFTKKNESLMEIRFQLKRNYMNRDELKQMISILKYALYDTWRYRVNYKNSLDEQTNLVYENVEIQLATWNENEFVTIKVSE